ncbi:MAG: hypothetical protein LW689_00175 [Novosphingobium sp.]|jgi:hypothetical protein|nr:hypothetical protein [Novosphingobium sp.]
MTAKKAKAAAERPNAADLQTKAEADKDRFKEMVMAWHARWRMNLQQEAENELLALLGR